MSGQHGRESMGDKLANGVAWLSFLSQALETSVAVFIRTGFGARYFGYQALATLLILLLYPLLWIGHDVWPLYVYFFLFLLALLVARIGQFRRHLRGEEGHSRYSGRPLLLAVLGKCDERLIKRVVEPVMVIVIGMVVTSWHEPLGSYFMVAGIAMFLSTNLTDSLECFRVMDVRDAVIEQVHRAERFRRHGRRAA